MIGAIIGSIVSAFVMLVAMLAVQRRQLKAARVEPAPGVAALPPGEVCRRLVEFAGVDGPISVQANGGDVTATWQLVGIPWATTSFRRGMKKTWALDFRPLEGGRTLVRMRGGKVTWETHAATWMPKGTVRWSAPEAPSLSRLASPSAPVPPVSNDTERTLENLAAPLRRVILDCGHVFEPVVDFPR